MCPTLALVGCVCALLCRIFFLTLLHLPSACRLCVLGGRSTRHRMSASSSSSMAAESTSPPSAVSSRDLAHANNVCMSEFEETLIHNGLTRRLVWQCPDCDAEHDASSCCLFVIDSIGVFVCAAAPNPRLSPWRSLVYVLLLCDSVAAAMRPLRQARIRT